ncbi:TPA: hypothetical protein ACN787_002757 [Citrobacter freundii]
MEFTKERLIERCEEAIASLNPCAGVAEAKSLACFEIALAALTAPDCPPKDTGAVGRSMDASYRRQGAVTGWAACLHRILKGLE